MSKYFESNIMYKIDKLNIKNRIFFILVNFKTLNNFIQQIY